MNFYTAIPHKHRVARDRATQRAATGWMCPRGHGPLHQQTYRAVVVRSCFCGYTLQLSRAKEDDRKSYNHTN